MRSFLASTVVQDNLVLSTELIMSIGHRKEVRKQTFRAVALLVLPPTDAVAPQFP